MFFFILVSYKKRSKIACPFLFRERKCLGHCPTETTSLESASLEQSSLPCVCKNVRGGILKALADTTTTTPHSRPSYPGPENNKKTTPAKLIHLLPYYRHALSHSCPHSFSRSLPPCQAGPLVPERGATVFTQYAGHKGDAVCWKAKGASVKCHCTSLCKGGTLPNSAHLRGPAKTELSSPVQSSYHTVESWWALIIVIFIIIQETLICKNKNLNYNSYWYFNK